MKEDFEKEHVLIGAGGQGAVIAEIIESMKENVHCFVDFNKNISSCLGYEVVHNESLLAHHEARVWLVSIGDNVVRKKIVQQKIARKYGTAIHPSSVISKSATIGEGTVVMAGACVNARASVGKHCIINTNSSVDHDCTLEDYVHISPGVSLAGIVHVGEGTHIGIGAVVIQNINIGKWCMIGAGAVVVRDIPDYAVVMGVPGRVVRIMDSE